MEKSMNGKDETVKDFENLNSEIYEKMGLKKKKCMDIISKISLVVSNFEKYAKEANIREKTYADIKKILDQNKVEI